MTKGVALLNFGGPQAATEVEPFLFNLFNDRDVIRLPVGSAMQKLLARRVARRRSPEIIEQYAAIGGASPLVPVTLAQAEALRVELGRRLGDDAPPVAVGMRYTAPFADATVQELVARGVTEVIALALYPHYSLATTGSSFNDLARALDRAGMTEAPVTWIPGWFNHPRYLAALADRIREGHARLDLAPDVHLMFSAHGLPSSYVRAGDPYQTQVQATVREALRVVGWTGSFSLAWQSRVGPVRWLAPSTDHELHRLGEAGVRALLVVPVSFVGDHIETLYEIDVTYREVARAAGIGRFEVTRGLDTHPELIGCLADLVEQAVLEGDRRPCVRCLLPREETHHYARVCPDCHFRKPAFLVREQERRERVQNAQPPR